jgi:hypothetical protein
MSAASIHGCHGPNSVMTPLDWLKLGASGARHVKFLWPEVRRSDAEAAQAAGLKVLIRAPGEGLVDSRAVKTIFDDLAGVMDALELGNEPTPGGAWQDFGSYLWVHAWYLEAAIHVARPLATTADCLLVSPGWRGEMLPPAEGTLLRGWDGGPADYVVPHDLAERLGSVYRACDRIAIHCYDPWTLATTGQRDRLLQWRAWGWHKLIVSEFGIAGPLPDAEKVRRYASFLALLAALPDVEAAFVFILGGTKDWQRFNGDNSYWLEPAGWAMLGQAVAALG